ncbi:MAG: DUF2807 domain-containing protein [Alistipes sp.]|nr:DUF2807 domain-containing protein [Alistipes sp.]
MRRFIILSLLMLTITTATADEVTMKAYKCQKEYKAISVGGPIKLFVEERTDGNIIVRATEKIHNALEIKVEEKTLKVTLDNFHIKRKSDTLQAEVYIPNNGMLEEFTALACGIIEVKPEIKAKEAEIECAAASRIDVNVVADQVTIDVLGASTAKVAAVCQTISADLTGASSLTLTGKATKGEFDIVGASTLKGSEFCCSQTELDCSGASTANISADSADVDTAGASTANIVCTTHLTASASGASTIRYSGECKVDITNNSGASTIKRK